MPDPFGVQDLVAVEEGELGIHQVDALLEDGDGFFHLFYEGDEVIVRERIGAFALKGEGNLPKGGEVPGAVGGGGADEEVAVRLGLVGVEVRMQGFSKHPVEVAEFLGCLQT